MEYIVVQYNTMLSDFRLDEFEAIRKKEEETAELWRQEQVWYSIVSSRVEKEYDIVYALLCFAFTSLYTQEKKRQEAAEAKEQKPKQMQPQKPKRCKNNNDSRQKEKCRPVKMLFR